MLVNQNIINIISPFSQFTNYKKILLFSMFFAKKKNNHFFKNSCIQF